MGEGGDFEKFKELIKKETKETIDQVDFYGYTALHAAAENGRLEMIPMLLDAGANINQATYDATFTSLHHALAKGHFECAQLLVDRGADLNLLNEGGCFGTSLHYAVFKDNLDFVKMLIGKGADVNVQDEELLTPLHFAARDGSGECAMLLVKAGADLFAKQNEGKTAKDLADFVNEQEMTAFLASCETGLVPDKPPQRQVRAPVVHKEIVIPEGWVPG